MIFDQWRNFSNYAPLLPEVAEAMIAFQRDATPDMANGSCELCGKLAKALVFDSKTTAGIDAAVWEIHHDYADIQTLLVGAECNYCRPTAEGLTPTMAFDSDKDYQLFQPELLDSALQLALTPATFAVYFPKEAHITSFTIGNGTQPIRKIVFKVHHSLFNRKGQRS